MKQGINLSTGLPTNELQNAIRSSHVLKAIPKLTVDWNWNRYASPTATCTPAEDELGIVDIEAFPVESLVEPQRPNKGAAKAIVGQSKVSSLYARPHETRFYIGSVDSKYKYWISPDMTNNLGNFANHTDSITLARPEINYAKVVKANKIVIRFENSWATPENYEVRIKSTLAGSWSAPIGGANPSIDLATGVLELFYNGTAWVSQRPATLVEADVAGIQLRVTSMRGGYDSQGNIVTYTNKGSNTKISTTGANSFLSVISMEAHLEHDLSDRLISCDYDSEMSDKSQLYPIGTITTNQSSMVLANEDGIFNTENSGIYQGLIEPNAEVNITYIYDLNGTEHSVQVLKAYTGDWRHSDDGTVNVEMEDESKFLKEIKPNSMLLENRTSNQIIWQVLDSVGFVNYEIGEDDTLTEHIVPVFWTDGEQTVWEVLDSLAQATQTAIYFDSEGVLQVRTRSAAFRDTTPDWTLRAVASGNELPDISAWTDSNEYEANKIDVTYKNTKWKKNSMGKDAMSKVWEPEGESVVLRAAPIKRTIELDSTFMRMDEKEVRIWPYEGKVQVNGEIIAYEGKQYAYYTYDVTRDGNGHEVYSNPVRNLGVPTSDAERKKLNRKTPGPKRFKNGFTGNLKIVERGVWNTEERRHPVELTGWNTKVSLNNNATEIEEPWGMFERRAESTVRINTPRNMNDLKDYFWFYKGAPQQSDYKHYGIKFRFNKDKAAAHQRTGIAFNMRYSIKSGYYVQVKPSKGLTAKNRKNGNEVTIYSRKNGKNTIISKGWATAVGVGTWYELDVHKYGSGNNQTIVAWLNGQKVAQGTTTAETAWDESGQFGIFARGKTNADYEYIYAVNKSIKDPLDDYGFWDLRYGGIRGNAWHRKYMWEIKSRRRRIRKKRWKWEKFRKNIYVFDEFAPYAHEIREYDIKFSDTPVRYSYLFSTNDWYSATLEFSSTPFGAKFVLANVSRDNAVVHGEDNLIFAGAGAAVNQVLTVLGQTLEIEDGETVTRKNESAIKARGVIESELSSDWIQNKAMARDLADWMRDHWSTGVGEVSVEIFGNPLIEIGDIVAAEYPEKEITSASHQYFVVGVNNSYEEGPVTNLTLRRRV